jgi:hypothetical protein
MNLRLDHLLEVLRSNPADILRRIDADPLLLKRTSGGLVLANAGPALFTPQESHQLYAKGIVYTRDPWAVVSLPLVKIYNLGERDVGENLHGLATDPLARLRFLRKFDGTLIQRFEHGGRVWFTTRGMLEGAAHGGVQDEDAPPRIAGFDFLGTARRLAQEVYPAVCEPRPELAHLTLLFEFLHPETRVITNYGERQDLVLLAAFDRRDWRYLPHHELFGLALRHELTLVDSHEPVATTLPEQIDALLASIAGTDQEGFVIAVEHGDRVVYRAKVKSPDYLRVLRLVMTCTYARTVEMMDANGLTTWAELEAVLLALGREKVPEEVLAFYREHFDAHATYLADCDRLAAWGTATAGGLLRDATAAVGDADRRALRKAFAARAAPHPLRALLFAAFDGKLTVGVVRAIARTPAEAAELVARIPPA